MIFGYVPDKADCRRQYRDIPQRGIEVYTPNMSAEQKAELIKYAKAHKLLTTGGTNFKGLYNKHILSVGDCDLPDECVNELLTYKSRQKKAQRKAAQAKANEKLQEALKK